MAMRYSQTCLTERQLRWAKALASMVDTFALGLAHLLLALTFWRLSLRADLDQDELPPATSEGADSDA